MECEFWRHLNFLHRCKLVIYLFKPEEDSTYYDEAGFVFKLLATQDLPVCSLVGYFAAVMDGIYAVMDGIY